MCLLHRPVGQHSADQQTGEDVRVENVDGAQLPHGHIGAEQSERDEGSRADSEALTDGGSGVAGRIECVGDVAHLVRHTAHLGQTACVVADGAVRVDGEADGQRG